MFGKIQNFFMGSYEEFKKIIWPSQKIVISHTVMVIVSIAIGLSIIALLDFGLFSLVQRLINGI